MRGFPSLASAIQAARRVPLDRFLYALGIPSVGLATATVLAGHFVTLGAIRAASLPELAAVPNIGPAAASAIAAFFHRPDNQAVIDALLRHGVMVLPSREREARDAETVVFTGTLQTMARADARRLVERRRGRVGDRVTRATSLVVAGSEPGSRLERARELHIPIITERQFLRRYGRGIPTA